MEKEQQLIIVGQVPTKKRFNVGIILLLPLMVFVVFGAAHRYLFNQIENKVVAWLIFGLFIIGMFIYFFLFSPSPHEFWGIRNGKLIYFNNPFVDPVYFNKTPHVSGTHVIKHTYAPENRSNKRASVYQFNKDVRTGNFENYLCSVNLEAIETIKIRWWILLGTRAFAFPVTLLITLKDKSQINITAMVYNHPKEFVQAMKHLIDEYRIKLIDNDNIYGVLKAGKQDLYEYLKEVAELHDWKIGEQ